MLGSSFISNLKKSRQMIDQRIKAARRSNLIKSHIITTPDTKDTKDTPEYSEESEEEYYEYSEDVFDIPEEKPQTHRQPKHKTYIPPQKHTEDTEEEEVEGTEEEDTEYEEDFVPSTPVCFAPPSIHKSRNTHTPTQSQKVQEAQENMQDITGIYPTKEENTKNKPGPTHIQQLETLAGWVNNELLDVGASFVLEDAKRFARLHSTSWEDWATTSCDTFNKLESLKEAKEKTRIKLLSQGFDNGLNTPLYTSEIRMTMCSEDSIIKFFTDIHTFSIDRDDYKQLLEIYAYILEEFPDDEDKQKQAYGNIQETIKYACIDPSYELSGRLFAPPINTHNTCNTAPIWRLSASSVEDFDTLQTLLYTATIVASILSRHYTGEDVRSGILFTGCHVDFVVCTMQPPVGKWYLSRCASFLDVALFAVEQLDGVDVSINPLIDTEDITTNIQLDDPEYMPIYTHLLQIVEDFTKGFDNTEYESETDDNKNIYTLRYKISKLISNIDA